MSFQYKYKRRTRTVFLSLPGEEKIVEFCTGVLKKSITEKWSRLSTISYKDLKQGRWMKRIEWMIGECNVLVAFLNSLNSNVLYEVGQATALGKPIVFIAPEDLVIPSMINTNQIIKYSGNIDSPDNIDEIVKAIDESVFSVLNRQGSDERTNIQKELMLGTKMTSSYYVSPNEIENNISDEEENDALELASDAYYQGKFMEATQILESCIKRGSKNEKIFHLLADSYFLWCEGTHKKSLREKLTWKMLQLSNQGLQMFPESILLRKDRGLALLKNYLAKDAKEQFEQLYLEFKEELIKAPFIPYNLACSYALMKDIIPCLRYLREAIDLRPDYQELARIDPDFDPVWQDQMFQSLVFSYKR